ncbi:hypothetical protein ENBRE01_0311 [Enteropsectra breve]|nr:hypothetical protein ENBRE01_0311 [Enteropsectra breve]
MSVASIKSNGIKKHPLDTPEGNKRVNKILYTCVQILLMLFLGLITLQLLLFVFFKEYYLKRSFYRGDDFLYKICAEYLEKTLSVIFPLIFAAVLLFISSYSDRDIWSSICRKTPKWVQFILYAVGSFFYYLFVYGKIKLIKESIKQYNPKTKLGVIRSLYLAFSFPLMLALLKSSLAKVTALPIILRIHEICEFNFIYYGIHDSQLLVEVLTKLFRLEKGRIHINDIETQKSLIYFIQRIFDPIKYEIPEDSGKTFYLNSSPHPDIQKAFYSTRTKFVYGIICSANYFVKSASCGFKYSSALIAHNFLLMNGNYHLIRIIVVYIACLILTAIIFILFRHKREKNSITHGILQASVILCIFVVAVSMIRKVVHYFCVLLADRRLTVKNIADILHSVKDPYFKSEYEHTTYNFDYEFFNCLFYGIPSYMRRLEHILDTRRELLAKE